MAIHIDDYKMYQTSERVNGLIPYETATRKAVDSSQIVGGALTAVNGAVALTGRIQKLVSAGSMSEVKRAVDKAYLEEKEQFGKRTDYEELEREWPAAFRDRVGRYMPEKLNGVDREQVNELVNSYEQKGSVEVQALSQLGMLNKAKESWKQGVRMAVDSGDIEAVEREIEQGRDLFVAPDEEKELKDELSREALEKKYLEEVHRNPFKIEMEIEKGEHPIVGDEEMERKILPEIRKRKGVVKAGYGSKILLDMDVLGEINPGSLNKGIRNNLISKEQEESYRKGMDVEREAQRHGVERSMPEDELCGWIRKIDEMNDLEEEMGELAIEIACSGMPRKDLKMLSTRWFENTQIPYAVRYLASKELAALHASGVWGAPSDEMALRELKKKQEEVFLLNKKFGKDGHDEIVAWLDKEKKAVEKTWINYKSKDEWKKEWEVTPLK